MPCDLLNSMKIAYLVVLIAFFTVISGCAKNYYEVGGGLYCLDENVNSICDKDETNPDNLYEFKPGFFCADANENKKCDAEESSNSTSAVNNTISSKIVSNNTSASSPSTVASGKTEHEKCLEKYEVEKGSVIYRYASWDPFLTDNDATYKKGLEDDGYTVVKDKVGTDTKDSYDASELMKECFEGIYSAELVTPPEFICSNNKDLFTKDYPSYNDVKQFAMDCKNAKVV